MVDPWSGTFDASGFSIHSPKVGAVDLLKILDLSIGTKWEWPVRIALRILRDGDMWSASMTEGKVPRSRASKKLVKAMVEADILREIPFAEVRAWGLLTSVPEASKCRFRPISDMLWSNAVLPETLEVRFRSYKDLIASMGSHQSAAVADFKAWYFQIPIGQDVQPYLAVNVGGKMYTHMRGPMGHKWMVFVAHTLTSALAWDPEVWHDVIIDNVMYAGDPEVVSEAMKRFNARCRYVGQADSDRTVGPVSTMVEHRGLCFDLAATHVGLRQSWRSKAVSRVDSLLLDPSVGKVQSIGGMMAWARMVGTNVEDYNAWRLVMRCARVDYVDERISLTQSEKAAVRAWASWVESNPVMPLLSWNNPDAMVVTDASLSAGIGKWGGIVVTTQVRVAAGNFPKQFSKTADIATLEMAALWLTVVVLTIPRGARLVILSDNQAMVTVLNKRRSRSFKLHTIGKAIWGILNRLGVSATVHWVPSNDNPADGISRQRELSDEDVRKLKLLTELYGMETEEKAVDKIMFNSKQNFYNMSSFDTTRIMRSAFV